MEISKEQAEALQEKLKNMSPEELKEFQKQQCIFCHIIEGKVASKKVYEDESCMAILDINPANPGHILLLPKEHYSIMPQLNEDEVAHLFIIAKQISHVLLKAFKVEGTNIFVANGVVAGQRAQHMMIHIIPRKEKDGLNFTIPQNDIAEKDLNTVRNLLIKAISEKMEVAFEEKAIKEKVVEAEFKEKKEPKKTEPKKKEAKKKKKVKKSKKQGEASLDDIAELLGAK